MSSNWRLSVAGASVLALCCLNGVEVSSAQTPRPEPGSILVLSVPSGLKVYFGSDSGGGGADEKGWVSFEEEHPIIAETNLKGVTPVLIRNVKPGRYLIGIAPILLIDSTRSHKETDPTLPAKAFVSATKLPAAAFGGERFEGIKGAAVYSVIRESTAAQRVIVLAVRDDATLEALDSIYPRETNITFDEAKYAGELKERTLTLFTDEEAKRVIDLLKRGGKVVVTRGDLRFLSEIALDGTWTIKTQVRAPGKR